MCLSTVDEVTGSHTTGFKFFERKDSTTFIGKYGRELFKIGLWYVDKKELNIESDDRKKYKTGFHYLTEMPTDMNHQQLNRMCYDNKEIIALIEVRDIVITGSDSTTHFGKMKAGVCRKFRIKKILYGKMSDYKKFMKYKLPPIYKELASFYTKYKDHQVNDAIQSFYDIVLVNSKAYFDTVNFIDLFGRNSKIFKYFTSIHIHALRMNLDYEKMYWSIIAASSPAYYCNARRVTGSYELANEFVEHFRSVGKDNAREYHYPLIASFERDKCHRIILASYLKKLGVSIE